MCLNFCFDKNISFNANKTYATEIIIPPPDIDFSEEPESQAGPSEPIDQQSDKTSDILPLALSPDTDDSDMPTISGPTYKAKAPKNGKKTYFQNYFTLNYHYFQYSKSLSLSLVLSFLSIKIIIK